MDFVRFGISPEDVSTLVKENKFLDLKSLMRELDPADLADLFEEVGPRERVILFRLLPKDKAIEVFELMEGRAREEMLSSFTDSEVAQVIGAMSDDERTELLEELPAKTVKKLLTKLPPEERELANLLLNYPENSAGRLMTTEFIDLKHNMTVERALERIRRDARKKETIYTCFVIDDRRKLLGTVRLEEIILAEPGTPVGKIMEPNPVFVHTHADREEVARIMSHYKLDSIPVVDSEERLVGIITLDDVLEIIEEETTEDIHKMAGMGTTTMGYFETPIWVFIKNRLPWLVGLLLFQSLSAMIVGHYEHALSLYPILAAFMATMIDAGGNAGGQSSTLVIRSMALGDLEVRHWWRVLLKELFVGALMGLLLGFVLFLRGFMITGDPRINLSAGFALFVIIVVANVVGAMLPFMGRLARIDPAVMSSPLITTLADLLGIGIYFYIASSFLGL